MRKKLPLRRVLALLGFAFNASGAEIPKKPFMVFDAMTYLEKPKLFEHGLIKTNVIYQQFLYPKGQTDFTVPPSAADTAIAVSDIKNRCNIVLDIEKWPLFDGSSLNNASVAKYLRVLNEVKSRTQRSVGYYGLVPIRDYYSSISSLSIRKSSWVKKNKDLTELVKAVDALYPSLYTFYDDQEEWTKFAISTIKAARDIAPDKPVFVFLWPRFHESNTSLKNAWIPPDFWLNQLSVAAKSADGAVIWGGWDLKENRKLAWNDKWPWWQVTRDFLASLKASNKLRAEDCE